MQANPGDWGFRVNAEHGQPETTVLKAQQIIAGRYRLLRPIGSGGMASVWAARHELLARDVAIKITPASGKTAEQTSRLLREASIVGRLSHENVVTVLDAGRTGDPNDGTGEAYLFLVMELLRGTALSDRFVPGQPLPAEEIVPIMIGVCRGLEAAHAAGVVHRDVKPENVFLAETTVGTVAKLLDFGISRVEDQRSSITLDGQILGTPAYMSPEQALGTKAVDGRADLWAVGVILYEALSGQQPFGSSSHHAVLRRIVDDDPEPLPTTVDGELRVIVGRCLEKDPEDRYQDAVSLRIGLERWLARARETRALSGPTATPLGMDVAMVAGEPLLPGDVCQDRATEIELPAARAERGLSMRAARALTTVARHPRGRAAILGAAAAALLCVGAVSRRAPASAALESHIAVMVAPPAPTETTATADLSAGVLQEATDDSASELPAARARARAPTAAMHTPAAPPAQRPLTRVTSPGF